jgi:hypothetical protein
VPNVGRALERHEVGARLDDDAEHEQQDAERAAVDVAAGPSVDFLR